MFASFLINLFTLTSMKENEKAIFEPSERMDGMQDVVYMVEAFLSENYRFRRNILSGKTELAPARCRKGHEPKWKPVTAEEVNSIVRRAKKACVGGKRSPKVEIEEYIYSNDIPAFNPIREYLSSLPEWDGRNHVADLFGRIPDITTEQLSWCSVWMRSMVAHWMGMDLLHGNECVPVLIGPQGCGKSTFAVRLLPEQLRSYFLDHINFGNKFDSEMALTHNLIVNIDEFANMGSAQQARLKQMLSKVKVNGRPIFGRLQEDRIRYASFLATTNDLHPLCDTTGSRRYLCLRIRNGLFIDNHSPINYAQLYAQVKHELLDEKVPYWFTADEVSRIQTSNLPFLRTDDMESILHQCFRLPRKEEEGVWLTCKQVGEALLKVCPSMRRGNSTNIRIGQTLKYLGCQMKHTYKGSAYRLIEIAQ